MFKSHGHLRKLYRNYNARYFENKLPENTIVCWSAEIPVTLHGHTRLWTDHDGVKTFEIRLNPEIRANSCWYKIVLMHEMAHIQLYPDCRHGKKFDKAMLALACQGAFNGLW